MHLEIFKEMLKKMDKFIFLNKGKINWKYKLRYGIGIIWNYIFYEATISDYFELRLFEKSREKKKEYLTSKQGLQFAQYVDSEDIFIKLCSKQAMYKELGKFTKREQLYSEKCTLEEFKNFIGKHSEALYKPDVADCGRGIEKWTFTNTDIESLYAKFKK